MKVPLLDLKSQHGSIRDEVLAAVSEVLDSQVCILGPKVEELEERVAALSDCKYGVGVSSGTDAILAALMALEIGPGDEVIVPSFTFFATAGCVSRVGATPVFVDIDRRTYNMDPGRIEQAIKPKTKAVIPVHLFGQMCDMDPIMAVARRHDLFVIEDAAQAISATYNGRRAGSIGTVSCLSFYPTKNLGGAGDGGMVVTNDAELYEKLLVMRNHGMKPKYYHQVIGGNFRLDPLQAAVLLVKLPHLAEWSEARRRNAAIYNEAFAGSPISTPWISSETISIFNQYVIRVDGRDELIEHLQANQIGTEIYYPVPLHLQECFKSLGYRESDLPESARAALEAVALPIYPELTRDQIEFVCRTILDWTLRHGTSASGKPRVQASR
jgi:dTDP-4-amino-4,6-dideoxygalactose transaminase